jgi:hypothetical protein
MRLRRKRSPIVLRRTDSCFHYLTLGFVGTKPQGERSLGKNVQGNLANPRTVKIRKAVVSLNQADGGTLAEGKLT